MKGGWDMERFLDRFRNRSKRNRSKRNALQREMDLSMLSRIRPFRVYDGKDYLPEHIKPKEFVNGQIVPYLTPIKSNRNSLL